MPVLRPKTLPRMLILSGVAIFSPTGASAQERAPAALQKVVDCRAIADDKARLACFDASVAQLDAARASGDVVAFDREEVKKTRRRLFGFSLPGLSIFGGGDKDGDPRKRVEQEEVKEIVGKIGAVSKNRDGGWVLTLEDGARWEQMDSITLGRSPKPGATLTIKRAALGSYKMSVDGGPSMKARRIG